MIKNTVLIIGFLLYAYVAIAQDLSQQRLWKISDRKKSLYFDKGVFHLMGNEKNGVRSILKSVRNSFVPSRGYERVVLDFSQNKVPEIYGSIVKGKNILFIDLMETEISGVPPELKNAKYLKGLKFFDIDKSRLSMEMEFKPNVVFDIFYLTNPGRLVIDIRTM